MTRRKSNPRRILLVARDLQQADFSDHIAPVMKVAEAQKADTVSFALFTFREQGHSWGDFFRGNRTVQRVLIEIGDFEKANGKQVTQLWQRHRRKPTVMVRQFARSSEPANRKLSLISKFKSRVFGTMLTLICGELSIINTVRGSERIKDPFGFRKLMRRAKIDVVLAPAHTRMARYEMNIKRQALSRNRRLLVSVWNTDTNNKLSGKTPWVAYRNGRKIPIETIANPVRSRPDIQFGLVDVRGKARRR
jgi:hypothetical protein